MGTMTRSEMTEALDKLKRTAIPRCSAERLTLSMEPPESWAEIIERPAIEEMIDKYLRMFVAPVLTDDGLRTDNCPMCGGHWTSWDLAWGAVVCSCGYPGRLYHRIKDTRTDDDLICSAATNGHRVCTSTRGEHVLLEGTEILRCPSPTVPPGLNAERFTHDWSAPDIAGFSLLLWVHPYTVHISRSRR